MPTDTQRVRLTEETYDRARIELAMLRMARATGSIRRHTDPEQRAVRIRELQELISRPSSDMSRLMTASPSPAWC
jgi:hypothetical protein